MDSISAVIDLKEFLHMKQGDGEFSYAQNTIIQRAASSKSKSIIEKAVRSLLKEDIVRPGRDQVIRIADLGSGVGPIPLDFISTMVENVHKNFKDQVIIPELQIYLNDLPSNDFNLLLKDVAELRSKEEQREPWWMPMAVAGSFHGRLFPRNSLHFVHSNYALHWLSQIPSGLNNEEGSRANRSNIFASETSTPAANEAYLAQFQKDWTSFFRCRSEEVITGGRLVFVIRGRPSARLTPNYELHLLGQAIASLVSKGMIRDEKLETFNFPAYCPSKEDIQEVVQNEGSFEIEHMETILDNSIAENVKDTYGKAETIAKCVRGFSESVVSHHFGVEIVDALYDELTSFTLEYLSKEPLEICSIIVSLRRRPVPVLFDRFELNGESSN